MTRSTDFSLAELHAALDARRQARGLTWAGATREINGQHAGSVTHPIASATVTTLRTKAVAEADGVLAMLRWLQPSFPFVTRMTQWLGRPVADFVRLAEQ